MYLMYLLPCNRKDLQCKYISILVSAQKMTVSNFPLVLINKASKNASKNLTILLCFKCKFDNIIIKTINDICYEFWFNIGSGVISISSPRFHKFL